MNEYMNPDGSGKWWEYQKWHGLKRTKPREKFRLSCGAAVRPCLDFSWVGWVVPSESQHGPSCAGHGIVNFKETMLRRYSSLGKNAFPMWKQLDGDAVWKFAKDTGKCGDYETGLYIQEAFDAALAMGIFVAGSELKTIPRGEALFSPQFEKTPFIDGHDVSAWVNRGVNSYNGQVYEGGVPNGTGGHCTLHVSRMTQDRTNYWQNLNSWGPSFGWHGLFMTSEWYDDLTGLDDVMYYVVEPEGWEKDDGWKKYVITG